MRDSLLSLKFNQPLTISRTLLLLPSFSTFVFGLVNCEVFVFVLFESSLLIMESAEEEDDDELSSLIVVCKA